MNEYISGRQIQNKSASFANTMTAKLLALQNPLGLSSAKAANHRSFHEIVTKGLGMNLRTLEEFDAMEKASHDLYKELVKTKQ